MILRRKEEEVKTKILPPQLPGKIRVVVHTPHSEGTRIENSPVHTKNACRQPTTTLQFTVITSTNEYTSTFVSKKSLKKLKIQVAAWRKIEDPSSCLQGKIEDQSSCLQEKSKIQVAARRKIEKSPPFRERSENEAAVLRKTKIQVAARNNQVAAQKNEVAARRKIEDPSSCPEKKLKIQVAARKNEVAVRNHLFYDTRDKY